MSSKFDYADPGQDDTYCNGLTTEDTDASLEDDSEPEIPASDPPVCAWCGGPFGTEGSFIHECDPFCSALCALHAEIDSQLDCPFGAL